MLVLDNSTIKAVIDEYAKSEIQSEAEVRSKLVVPLLCALGYPSELRAEEFPVYGFGGRKKLPAKSADFLLFSDKEFGAHRNDTQKDKDWVQSHSLLIVEAKKPGEMPDSPGQAQFYTMWTKAVAYMVTDGCEIQAYCYSDISADYRIICCTTNELPYIENLGMLSFDNVRAIKEKEQVAWQECNALQNSTEYPVHIITDDAELNLPNETLAYIRNALGRNADGLSNVQLVAKYLNATDSFLQNDLRYDIPAYMIDIPRGEYSKHSTTAQTRFTTARCRATCALCWTSSLPCRCRASRASLRRCAHVPFRQASSFRIWRRSKSFTRIAGRRFRATAIPFCISAAMNPVRTNMCPRYSAKPRSIRKRTGKRRANPVLTRPISRCPGANC